MNIIKVHSLPLKDVIKSFAISFDAEITENCGEYTLELPSSWGTGIIKGINFEGGLGMIQYHCIFNEDLEIQFVVDEIHPLKYIFCLEGSLSHRFEEDENLHLLDQFQNVIVASERRNGHILNFTKNIFTDIYSLEIDRKVFKKKMECVINLEKPKLQKMFKDDTALDSFYYKGLYSLVLAMLFQEVKEFRPNGLIKKIFTEGKAYQILANQLIQYDDDDKDESNRNLLRKSEVKSIMEAISHIENNLDGLGSVKSIGLNVGLNGNKIQDGFKSLYGLTVNEYIQKTRLEVAKNLLLQTEYSVQEIMLKVGWNSKSYFSKIFKDHYFMSPTDFRKAHKGEVHKGFL